MSIEDANDSVDSYEGHDEQGGSNVSVVEERDVAEIKLSTMYSVEIVRESYSAQVNMENLHTETPIETRVVTATVEILEYTFNSKFVSTNQTQSQIAFDFLNHLHAIAPDKQLEGDCRDRRGGLRQRVQRGTMRLGGFSVETENSY